MRVRVRVKVRVRVRFRVRFRVRVRVRVKVRVKVSVYLFFERYDPLNVEVLSPLQPSVQGLDTLLDVRTVFVPEG